jgi:hypothetical protein
MWARVSGDCDLKKGCSDSRLGRAVAPTAWDTPPGEPEQAYAVFEWNDKLVATAPQAIWESADGTAWSQVASGSAAPYQVARSGDLLVGSATYYATPIADGPLLYSEDAVTWHPAEISF